MVNTGGTLDYTLGTAANPSWAASAPPPSYPGTGAPYVTTGAITSSGLAGKCADDDHSGVGNSTAIQLWDCNGTNAQKWAVPGDGTVQVMGKCMDVTNSGTTNGVKVQLWDCNGTGAQQWQVQGTGLVNPQSGRCLDDPGSTTTNGTQLQIWDCNSSNAQTWTLP
jgi:Ricin-type beta-trefoil lectin domain